MNLPPAVTAYLTAHNARDVDSAIASYASDAVVIDDGRTYHGVDEIRAWLAGAASEYTYTTDLISAARLDQEHYDVVQHLVGDFPGGVIDLHYRFTLRGAAIARLVIEP
ncbi:nuclear transport factor 2 family protein [Dactylosporangium sp. NBC_01737]|uniref:nuclear transport factor 2 family protein n=1 Tax=Dactylosporangium sp. NBC_01737 TaxID=2975959 RepID=UPI002E150FCF|nr:nuclear transport factor 2 family protein [Dactylosporangium sp. NBC_01737]